MCGNNKNCNCNKTHDCYTECHSHDHSCHTHSHEHHCHNVYFDARSGCKSNISCILSSDKIDTSKVKYIVKYNLDKKRQHCHNHHNHHSHDCSCGCH